MKTEMEPYTPKFNKGDTVYMCARDGETIWFAKSKILDVIQTFTPTGRPRAPSYKIQALNYQHKGMVEYEEKCADFESVSYRSAVDATCEGLRRTFNSLSDDNPETRLLNAIFLKPQCTPVITPDMLGKVISDLLKFHRMFSRAFEIDSDFLEQKAAAQGVCEEETKEENKNE